MASYESNLEKYKKMQKKAAEPDVTPTKVVFDSFIGKLLLIIMTLLAFLLIFAALGGAYEVKSDATAALLLGVCCIGMAFAGFIMNRAAKFYYKSRRWLRKPGTITMRQLAINVRQTEEDTLKAVRQMIQRRYYKNLVISEDKKTITIKPGEENHAKY